LNDDVRVELFEPDIFFTEQVDNMVFAMTDGSIADRDRIMEMDAVTVYEWYYYWMVRMVNKMRSELAATNRWKG